MMNEQEIQSAAPTRRSRIVKAVKWTFLSMLGIYVILVLFRTGALLHADETAKQVADIHSIRLTLADVDGSKLPPAPDPVLNDSTVEGIDTNKNFVRDDIERWIFEQYADQKERAVWMQWARAEEFVMTRAVSKETLVAIMEEGDRANQCASFLYRIPDMKTTLSELNQRIEKFDGLVLNTEIRKIARDKGYSHMTGSGPMEGQQCDVFPEVR